MKPNAPDGGTKTGILLVGHGTREAVGVQEFLQTARLVADALAEFALEPCFLELAVPTIATAVSRLLDRDIERLVVVPVLLFAAGHAKADVPRAVREALADHPDVQWVQAAHLGCHPAILALSGQRFMEALKDRPACENSTTALVLVGRGSHDKEAVAEMQRFATLIPQRTAVDHVEVCFCAMATPSLKTALPSVAAQGFARVIVQPHLLFGGVLSASIHEAVARCANQHPGTEWLVAETLGPTPLVAEAICAQIAAAETLLASQITRLSATAATT
jgi:sirohydrochlorin cobaltochelatase